MYVTDGVTQVAEYGTMKVEKLMEVERYSHVMHISSTVTGKLRPELSCWDVLRAALPAGTVSGAPKVLPLPFLFLFPFLFPPTRAFCLCVCLPACLPVCLCRYCCSHAFQHVSIDLQALHNFAAGLSSLECPIGLQR